jgi:hypothetical protein
MPKSNSEIFNSIQRCIDDASLYLPGKEFFSLLQDPGADVSEAQTADINQRIQEKKKPKAYTRQILHDCRLHKDISGLAQKLHTLWSDAKDVHFNELPRSESANIHKIGLFIAEKRQYHHKAQYPTCLADEGMEDIDISDEQDQIQFACELDSAYFLTQASVLKHFKCKWGQSLPDITKPTVNDKIRVAMLLFSDDIREYLPDILSKTKSAPSGSNNNNNNNRPNLDVSNARKKRGKLLLLNAFKDSDVIANLPAVWKDAAEYIDEKNGSRCF